MTANTLLIKRRPHHVVMVAYPDVQILDVTGPLEVFSRASRWMQEHGIRRELAYRVEVVAPRAGAFSTSSGVRLVAERSYREVARADTLLVAGGRGHSAARGNAELLAWLTRMAARVPRLGSVCTGALILAACGLLQGRRATTHWAYLQELHQRIGNGVCQDAIYTRDGNLYTSAGVTAGMDMALAMLEEDHGNAVALGVARELVMFLKRPGGQSQFSDHLAAQFSEDAGLRHRVGGDPRGLSRALSRRLRFRSDSELSCALAGALDPRLAEADSVALACGRPACVDERVHSSTSSPLPGTIFLLFFKIR